MTIHRIARTARASFHTAASALVFLPLALSPALAGERRAPRVVGAPTTYDTIGSAESDRTGSIPSTRNFGFPGRSMRSSTLGNAEFPERDPSAQNLGMTSGGGLD